MNTSKVLSVDPQIIAKDLLILLNEHDLVLHSLFGSHCKGELNAVHMSLVKCFLVLESTAMLAGM